MKVLGYLANLIARVFERVGLIVYRLGTVFRNLLPVFLRPHESTALLSRYYQTTYYPAESLGDHKLLTSVGFELESWEVDVCNRHGISSGRMLVLGCGWGREAIALAERKVQVVGLDLHPGVLSMGRRAATERNVPVQLMRGDFLTPPFKPGSFEYILLSGTMYSAIPGRDTRHQWLRRVRRLCKPNGLIMLSFQIDTRADGRLDRLTERLQSVFHKLPGTNPAYQRGDICQGGHFFHLFRDETELKAEFDGADAHLKELNWSHQYAVLG